MAENKRSAEEIIAEVRAIARDMAIYRPDPGELLPSIKGDIREFLSLERSVFKPWLDDRKYLSKLGADKVWIHPDGERWAIPIIDRIVDTQAGKLCAAIAISLLLAEWKTLHPEWTADRAEQELREAAERLPGLCDQLELAIGIKHQDHGRRPDADRTQALPLGLQFCDVAQTLKRDGFNKAVTIKNEDHWKLMEALITAFPNAVSEPKLKHIFQGPNDRDNYSRALKNSIDTIGLTVKNWVLTTMK